MQPTPAKILIFDSGVGAFSVFQEINQIEPSVHCTLALDNARFPYGTLAESELRCRVVSLVGSLLKQIRPDLVVIACNTASTLVLDELRNKYDIPFVGVVPAIKPAAVSSISKTIGLLATPATVERSYTDNLIEDFAPGCEVLRIGSSELVYMAEKKLRGTPVNMKELANVLDLFSEHATLDTLVLACTHFPLLLPELKQLLPSRINVLDSGVAIAQRVSSLLADSIRINSTNSTELDQPHSLFLMSPDQALDQLQKYSNELGFANIEVLEI